MVTGRTCRVVAVVVGLVALAACGTPPRARAPLPVGPQVVEVEMRDYSFAYDSRVNSGRVLLRVHNHGSVPHNLSIIPLTEDIPPIDEQLRGSERRAINPLARVKSRPPGMGTTLAVDLAPGVRYAFICFVRDPEGRPHFLRGMSTEFRTEGTPPSTTILPSSPG